MIELNSKTQQDFLNREWVQRLLDAGVDMSDCKYFIGKWSSVKNQPDIIVSRQIKNYFDIKSGDYALPEIPVHLDNVIPTYTVSELLYKLRDKQGIYTIFNNLRNNDIDNTPIIESLAFLLIQYHKKDIGKKTKGTGDISDK